MMKQYRRFAEFMLVFSEKEIARETILSNLEKCEL